MFIPRTPTDALYTLGFFSMSVSLFLSLSFCLCSLFSLPILLYLCHRMHVNGEYIISRLIAPKCWMLFGWFGSNACRMSFTKSNVRTSLCCITYCVQEETRATIWDCITYIHSNAKYRVVYTHMWFPVVISNCHGIYSIRWRCHCVKSWKSQCWSLLFNVRNAKKNEISMFILTKKKRLEIDNNKNTDISVLSVGNIRHDNDAQRRMNVYAWHRRTDARQQNIIVIFYGVDFHRIWGRKCGWQRDIDANAIISDNIVVRARVYTRKYAVWICVTWQICRVQNPLRRGIFYCAQHTASLGHNME